METHFDINFDEIVAAAVVPRRNGKSTKVITIFVRRRMQTLFRRRCL